MHRTLLDKGSVHPATAMGDYAATRAPLTVLRLISLHQQNVDLLHQYSYQRRCNLSLPRPETMAKALVNIAACWPGRLTTGCRVVIMICVNVHRFHTVTPTLVFEHGLGFTLSSLTEIISTDLPDNDMLLANMSTDLVPVMFIYFTWIS